MKWVMKIFSNINHGMIRRYFFFLTSVKTFHRGDPRG
jgi:hypothetical protein